MSAYLLPFSAILPGRLPPAIHSFIYSFIAFIWRLSTVTKQRRSNLNTPRLPPFIPSVSLCSLYLSVSLSLSLSVFLCLSLSLPVALSFSLLQISIQTESNRPVRALSHCMPVLSLHYPIVTDVLQSYSIMLPHQPDSSDYDDLVSQLTSMVSEDLIL